MIDFINKYRTVWWVVRDWNGVDIHNFYKSVQFYVVFDWIMGTSSSHKLNLLQSIVQQINMPQRLSLSRCCLANCLMPIKAEWNSFPFITCDFNLSKIFATAYFTSNNLWFSLPSNCENIINSNRCGNTDNRVFLSAFNLNTIRLQIWFKMSFHRMATCVVSKQYFIYFLFYTKMTIQACSPWILTVFNCVVIWMIWIRCLMKLKPKRRDGRLVLWIQS